jgi:hypothetical protein
VRVFAARIAFLLFYRRLQPPFLSRASDQALCA